MAAYAPFYVEIKTEDDNEMIPCADLETAEYCMSVLKRYGFKDTELHLLGELKRRKSMRLNQLLDKCENIVFDTPLMIGVNNQHIMYTSYTQIPEHMESKFVRFFRVYQWYVSIELED